MHSRGSLLFHLKEISVSHLLTYTSAVFKTTITSKFNVNHTSVKHCLDMSDLILVLIL